MTPSAVYSPSQEAGQPSMIKPPQMYPVKEAHFEKYLEPQPEGFERAVSRGPGNAAIVIDNGNNILQILERKVSLLTFHVQAPQLQELDGLSKMPLDLSSPLSWLGIEIESLEGRTHLRARTYMQIPQPKDI
jgi:hypothetical protein